MGINRQEPISTRSRSAPYPLLYQFDDSTSHGAPGHFVKRNRNQGRRRRPPAPVGWNPTGL